ncbi:helix-turn-helix domain-containing protein [Paenibacillus periandrae]|uniref:helix-turn-helix domain-containing protein n=1 Tax=Paenibacillus periandrae TaxID=1761741 RepID=UPI001F08A598|nr:helix-turn-helix transcriptional regulator [Paenibacillus periandrae]
MNIKDLRNNKQWSQMELARRSGVSQSFINSLETGAKDATSKTLRKLADALEVSISELLGENEQAATKEVG